MRTCRACQLEKEPAEFYSRSDTGRLRSECKVCCNDRAQANKKAKRAHYNRLEREATQRDPVRSRERKRRWLETHREEYRAIKRDYYQRNKDAWTEQSRRRRARIREQLGELPSGYQEALWSLQRGLCLYCGERLDRWEVEHMTPVAKGGLHDFSNVALACKRCNRRKGDKDSAEFFAIAQAS